MAERLFGMEIEYGCAVRGPAAARTLRDRDWSERFVAIARDRLPHLPSMDGSGIFLQNGARFYIDCSHPEMTTPECANPWDIVRYMQAGERMLTSIAEEMKLREPTVSEVLLFKTNVDHSGSGATWGCHTSFMHRGDPEAFPAQIIPHLVSRIVYSGAGGLELVDGRLRFTLSPRVRFLQREVSGSSTSERGIFHTKDETLAADGYHRLHIICGESLCSEIALWLNMGATALIVAMIEAGLRPGDAVRLSNPLATMRRFTMDPACRVLGQTTRARKLSAIQIQRHYLEMAEAHRYAPFMPPWADQVCAQWRAMLDRIEAGAPGSVATMLDWAMKLGLFLDRAERRGLSLEHWHHTHPAAQHNPNGDELPLSEEESASRAAASSSPKVLKVHQELCEIDTRFGQLGASGLFATLARAGVLGHHFAGVDNIEHAVANPPAIGRARLRGQCVQRFKGQNQRYACSWSHVVDRQRNVILDISNPFTTEEKWQKAPPGFRESLNSTHDHLHHLLNQARMRHDRGYHEAAAQILPEAEGFQDAFAMGRHPEYLRLRAWIQSRRGYLDGVLALDELAQSQPMDLSLANGYVCAYRYQGLIPPLEIVTWINRGRRLLAASDQGHNGAALPFLGHYGYWLLRSGKPEEALRVLQDACQPARRDCANPAAVARALADYGDACRALGRHPEAAALLDEAQGLQAANQFEGDLADFALTYRAKLASNPDQSLQLLAEAKEIQTRLKNLPGETRTLLLETRILNNPKLAGPVKKRLLQLQGLRPALSQCRLLAKILGHHWDAWTSGAPDPRGGADFYWWL